VSQKHVEVLEAIDSRRQGLRAEFFRTEGRWAHRLVTVNGFAQRVLLQSLEGGPHEAFPPSPALQQLAFQQLSPGHRVALLVGMAGKNHWSVSVEAFPDRRCLRFDAACRHQRVRDGDLGSAYQTVDAWRVAGAGRAETAVAGLLYELAALSIDGRDDPLMRQGSHDSLRLQATIVKKMGTQRWCYEVCQPSVSGGKRHLQP